MVVVVGGTRVVVVVGATVVVVPGLVPVVVVPGTVVVVPVGWFTPVGPPGAGAAKTGALPPMAATGPAAVGVKKEWLEASGVTRPVTGKRGGGAAGCELVVGGTVVVVAVVGVSELELWTTN